MSERTSTNKVIAIWRWILALFPTFAEWKKAMPAFGWAVLSVILLALCHAPLGWAWLAPVALAPLFWGLRLCKPRMAFFVGWWFGSLHAWMWIGWLTSVARFNPFIYVGIVPACMYLGIYAAATLTMISAAARRYSPWVALPLSALIWAGMDFWHSIGKMALPYGFVGQAALDWSALAQAATLGGMYVLTFLMVMGGLTVMEVIASFKAKYGQAEALTRFAVYTVLLVATLVYGYRRIATVEEAMEGADTISLALIQTGIDQKVKFDSYAHPDQQVRIDMQDIMFRSLLEQLDSLERGRFDLIVTPESSLTHDLTDADEFVQNRVYGGVPLREVMDRATDLETPIIVGGSDMQYVDENGEATESLLAGMESDGAYRKGYEQYGGLWLIRPNTEELPLKADYRKVRLMPFGEEVPYLSVIPGFQEYIVQVGTFGKGTLGPPLAIPVGEQYDEPRYVQFAPTICFEDQFPSIHRHYARQGAQLFVNTTNDGWFDGSSGPRWHMTSARWRSVETGLPMIRATNSGLTVAIDSLGRVIESIPALETSIMELDLPIPTEPVQTVYTRIGNVFGWLSFLSMVGTLCLLVFRKPEED